MGEKKKRRRVRGEGVERGRGGDTTMTVATEVGEEGGRKRRERRGEKHKEEELEMMVATMMREGVGRRE